MRPSQNNKNRLRTNRNTSAPNALARKVSNPLNKTYESNGPDTKIRGTPHHIVEKYLQLARDAQSSGDQVLAENFLQHSEHYLRIILSAQQGFAAPGGQQAQHAAHDFEADDPFKMPDRFASPFEVKIPDKFSEKPVEATHMPHEGGAENSSIAKTHVARGNGLHAPLANAQAFFPEQPAYMGNMPNGSHLDAFGAHEAAAEPKPYIRAPRRFANMEPNPDGQQQNPGRYAPAQGYSPEGGKRPPRPERTYRDGNSQMGYANAGFANGANGERAARERTGHERLTYRNRPRYDNQSSARLPDNAGENALPQGESRHAQTTPFQQRKSQDFKANDAPAPAREVQNKFQNNAQGVLRGELPSFIVAPVRAPVSALQPDLLLNGETADLRDNRASDLGERELGEGVPFRKRTQNAPSGARKDGFDEQREKPVFGANHGGDQSQNAMVAKQSGISGHKEANQTRQTPQLSGHEPERQNEGTQALGQDDSHGYPVTE